MHELGITRSIVAICEEHAEGRRVQRVALQIGRLSAILPDAIRFCFDVVTRGTLLEGAGLDIVEVAGRGRCRACGHEMVLEGLWGACEGCQGGEVECIAGQELMVKELELV